MGRSWLSEESPLSNMGLGSSRRPGPMLERGSESVRHYSILLPMGTSWLAEEGPLSNIGLGSSRGPGPMLERGSFSARRYSPSFPTEKSWLAGGPFSNMGLGSAGGPGPMFEAPPLPGAMGKSWLAGDAFSNMGVGSSRDPGPMLENGPFSARQHSIPLPLSSPALTSADQALLMDTHGWQRRGPLLTWVWNPPGVLDPC